MDLQKLKAYLQSLYQSSPVGMINSATSQAAGAAGVPAGASPLTDALKQGANRTITSAAGMLPNMPSGVSSAIDSGNSALDALHDKLFGLFNGK